MNPFLQPAPATCSAGDPHPGAFRLEEGLEVALARRDATAAAEEIDALMGSHSIGVSPAGNAEELAERRLVHETVDRALRGFLLTDDSGGDYWRSLLLPLQSNVLNRGNLLSNGNWLRRSGSAVPDENNEVLDPNVLATLDLRGQALLLGRFLVANDGARAVDFSAVAEQLDVQLLPVWTDWTLSCHAQSPDALAGRQSALNQERTLQDLLAYWHGRELNLPATPLALSTAYERPYRTAGSTLPVARKVLGELLPRLYWNMGPADVQGLETYPEFEALRGTEFLVFCSNWREKHVIHRCMSPLLEPLRTREASRVLMLHEANQVELGQCAPSWKSRSLELEMRTRGHYLYDIGRAAEELRSCAIDLMFFPELCPRDPSVWMAMQRVARVQATGYGFPSTSGSPHMDYFLGGADVEGDGRDYAEQLVLIPGWGQAIVEPPPPAQDRKRCDLDGPVQLATVVTSQKLNSELLEAWSEILRGEQDVHLEIFPSLQDAATQQLAPRVASHLNHGSIHLNGWTDRFELLDTLAQSDFYLDTFPYGGYNCLVEALACGLPIVTLEGDRARNRNGAALLRRLGLPEFLIAHSYPEYIAVAKRLIRDGGLRSALREQLADRDAVLAALHDSEAPAHFAAAMDWMREQGPRNGRAPDAPILIRAGERPRRLEG